MKLWCEHAWVGDAAIRGVVLTIDDDRIGGVEVGIDAPPDCALRLDGVTVPGFANAHSHAFHRALRGRTHAGGGTFWTWRDQMYSLADRLDPESYEALAAATFAEMVLAGYTVVGEFHYLHHGAGGVPFADPNEMGHRLLRAAARAGVRITLLDTCYLNGGVARELSPLQRRFSDGTVRAWAERVDALRDVESPTVNVGAAIHSVRAVDPPSIVGVSEWATTHSAPLHAHVSEQPQENFDCIAAYGCSPTELLVRHGVLSDRFTAVHATHVSGRDAARLGDAAASVCMCATTERDLADGVGPTVTLRDAGVALCIGSDSHAVIDPFEETRAIELDQRLVSLQRGAHTPHALLAAGASGGYRSLGWDGGVIAVGALADLVTVGLDSGRLAGFDPHDIAAAIVFAATAADVRDVFVGGRHVVCDGVHESIDVPAALASSIAAAWGEM